MELDELHEGVTHSLSTDRNLEATRALEPPRESAARQRVATALRMGSLARAAHHAAGDLEEQFPQAARCVHDAASGFESISNLLRDPNLDEVAALIGNLGRKQPAAIVAGVVLIGLGLSWFLTNSGHAVHRTEAGAAAD
jgi:DNA-binding PucR family transcriptional regulator